MSLSEITKKTRQALKLSQKDLALIIHSNQTEISFIERGFIPNDQEKINKIYELYKETMSKNGKRIDSIQKKSD